MINNFIDPKCCCWLETDENNEDLAEETADRSTKRFDSSKKVLYPLPPGDERWTVLVTE